MVGDMDYIYHNQQNTFTLAPNKVQEDKVKSIDVRGSKETVLSRLDEETKNKLKRKRLDEYLLENVSSSR